MITTCVHISTFTAIDSNLTIHTIYPYGSDGLRLPGFASLPQDLDVVRSTPNNRPCA